MSRSLASERGSGVVEALVAMMLLSVVMGAMVSVLIQQQRFYLVTNDAAKTQGLVEQLETGLSVELMPLNPAAGDVVYAAADSAEFRVFRGVYTVCDKRALPNPQITVRALTNALPVETDSALVYSKGTKATIDDDHWKVVSIDAVSPAMCPDSSPGWQGVVNELAGVLGEIPIGAPVRAFNHGSYWLATREGGWYLLSDAISGRPAVVSGPLAPADSAAAAVLSFVYLDDDEEMTTDLEEIERIEVDVGVVGRVPTTRGGEPLRRDRTVSIKQRNADR
ncbi:MAG: hypothetical protein JSU87_15720 [Gemmatimonadota bacterium]|nr:MAG: hypothetical protein JSU87_15720 [Gemmatimonadota bacterium]